MRLFFVGNRPPSTPRAYVEFPVRRRPGDQEHAWEGEIPASVYLAVRMGQIRTSRVAIMRYS